MRCFSFLAFCATAPQFSIQLLAQQMLNQKSHFLIATLQKIQKRYDSMFFTKLFLFPQPQGEEHSHIRHYDIECQAVTQMTDMLATKLKALKCRGFFMLKFYHKPATRTQSQYGLSRVKTALYSPNAENEKYHSQVRSNYFNKTSRLQPSEVKRTILGETRVTNTENSLSHVLSRLRDLKQEIKPCYLSPRVNPELESDPTRKSKYDKRKFIIMKLDKLQNDLSRLLEEQRLDKNDLHPSLNTSNVQDKPELTPGSKSFSNLMDTLKDPTSEHLNKSALMGKYIRNI